MQQSYLLIIDKTSWDQQFSDYFSKFNYKIIQHADLSSLEQEADLPAALLINSSTFQADWSTITNLYHRYLIPLIVINDKHHEATCVQALEHGADDFLIKPIHPRELHARINAITRRVQRSKQAHEKDILFFEEWRLYPASRQIFSKSNQELHLSAGEYDLLLAFVHQPQQVLGREFLLQLTKNNFSNPLDRRIDVQISRLRQKIETDTKKPALIKTIRNEGYLFTAEVSSIKPQFG